MGLRRYNLWVLLMVRTLCIPMIYAKRVYTTKMCGVVVVVVKINYMYPSTDGALFSGYRLCSAIS